MRKYLNSYPNLVKEFDFEKNLPLTPKNFSFSSGKQIWWKCLKGHEWKTRVADRTKIIKYKSHTIIGTGCPYCSNKKISKENNLMVLYPKLSQEWHPIKNGKLTSQQVTKGYYKKVWWKCIKGHEWKTTVNSRTGIRIKNKKKYFGTNCPFCSGLKVTPNKTIRVLFPKLVQQWHPSKNNNLKPEQFSKSSNKKIWWLCSNGHEWKTGIGQRTMGTNCPKCSFQSSKPEFRILSELETLFKKVDSRYKFKKTEIDIFIKDINIGIEYDGSYYHKNKKNNDAKKNRFLKKNSIKLIRVRHEPLIKLDSLDVIVKEDELTKKDLNNIVKSIYNFCNNKQKKLIKNYLKKKEFINNKSYNKYLSYFPAPIPKKSLAFSNNKLVTEWNYKKNYPLEPKSFYPKSTTRVWWKCSLGHEWISPIKDRANGNNCPYCAGRKVDKGNNLKVLMPILAKEWHPTKNGNLKPEEVTKFSGKKVWWLCSKSHEWKTGIANRSNGTNCPHCFNSKAKFTRVSSTHNLKVLMPNLAKEWHSVKNGNLKPEEVPKYSDIKVWWLCSKGHEWKTKIKYRSTGNNCPDCYTIKRKLYSKKLN